MGWPKKELVKHEVPKAFGITHRDLTEAHDVEELLEQVEVEEPPIDEEDPTLPMETPEETA